LGNDDAAFLKGWRGDQEMTGDQALDRAQSGELDVPTTGPKPFVFVLMPFAPEFDDIYKLGIRAACVEAGGYCERVDEQQYDGDILQRVYNQIRTADLIIADMTGRNPNVFYEVGYAHALDKRVILLTKDAADIPFDLKHYPHIVYEGSIARLKDALCARTKWAFSNAKDANVFYRSSLRCFIDDVALDNRPRLTRKLEPSQREIRVEFVIAVYNSPEQSIASVDFRIGVVTPAIIDRAGFLLGNRDRASSKMFRQPDGLSLHLAEENYSLLPGAWEKVIAFMYAGKPQMHIHPMVLDLELRILTTAGPVSFPFEIAVSH
jgi:hypothetical protein